MLVAAAVALPATAVAEQASQPSLAAAGQLDAGRLHSCAVLTDGSVRCWGYGAEGQLGYASTGTVGDNETPGSAGAVELGQPAKAISAGGFHTCALLDDGTVRCWGFGADGRLGYAGTSNIGDGETPGPAGPVQLGGAAKAISAGYGHTCAVLENGSVRCWGYGENGALGYGNTDSIGDDETPGSLASPVDLGQGRTATAVSAGNDHTCALLDDKTVRCWGYNGDGRLGSGDTRFVGDDESPGSVDPVALGATAAISAGNFQTCALLEDASVRCWGYGASGALGYGNTDEVRGPSLVGPVDLGPDRTAKAVSAGRHTCALLDDDSVRCWGSNSQGQLGYANARAIGDDELPGSAGPVDLGAGGKAIAVSADDRHTCARLADLSLRCWGSGANGRLGLCSVGNVGDDEPPGSVAPVNLTGALCSGLVGAEPSSEPVLGGAPGGGGPVTLGDPDGLKAQAARLRRLRGCLAPVSLHARREARSARRLSGSRRGRATRHLRRHRSQSRRRCLRRWGRTPGRVTGLKAQVASATEIVLTFKAPGTDGSRPPAARSFLVRQSRRPIRDGRAFRRAQALCKGSCRLGTSTRVGATVTVKVKDLRPRTTYYYAIAARDNVSRRLGPRTRAVRVRTR